MFKKFIIYICYRGYGTNDKILLLFIELPQLVGHYGVFKYSNKMGFICENNKRLPKNFEEIWKKKKKHVRQSVCCKAYPYMM